MGPRVSLESCPQCLGPSAELDAIGSRVPRRRDVIAGVIAPYSYRESARQLVLGLKFRDGCHLAEMLAGPMEEALRAADIPGDLLVPVPLSAKRMRERGYNQSALLAKALGRRLHIPVASRAVKRRVHGPPQTTRSKAQRRLGPRGGFVAKRRAVAGRCVMLVDDVITSGATARAVSYALLRAGALRVVVVVACRTERGA